MCNDKILKNYENTTLIKRKGKLSTCTDHVLPAYLHRESIDSHNHLCSAYQLEKHLSMWEWT